jgi:hypothetical protein
LEVTERDWRRGRDTSSDNSDNSIIRKVSGDEDGLTRGRHLRGCTPRRFVV